MIDLDLDKLENPSRKIKLNGKVMDLKYPSLSQLARMLKLAESAKSEKEEEIIKVIDDLSALFKDLIPEMGDYELNMSQIMALIKVFGEISTPEEVKGIETDTKKN